ERFHDQRARESVYEPGHEDGTVYYIKSLTTSWKGTNCDVYSPAPAGHIAAYVKLQRLTTSGHWYTCVFGPHIVNAGGFQAESDDIVEMLCGANQTYRMRDEWRITYNGAPHYGSDNTSSRTCPCT
ncbi:MAG TPA: hypothetical protein VK507_01900, partial [Iamia sp.]|nr:hypothetical protein [Iamia sp.]